MKAMTLANIQQVTGGTVYGCADVQVSSVVIDSRAVQPGSLFVAIKGERADGHSYLSQAQAAGAVAALVQVKQAVTLPQLQVENPVLAMTLLAKNYAANFAGQIIAITGSCGKTTTKEMLVEILQQNKKVAFTSGNQNNEIGVPLTVLAIDENAEAAVIEMGAAQRGDIAYLMDIVAPDISVITNIGSAHVGRFGDLQAIAETKAEIYRYLPVNGKAAINLDQPQAQNWLEMLSGKSVLTFSLNCADADLYVSEIKAGTGGSDFILHYQGAEQHLHLPVAGMHNISNALAAAACALLAGSSLADVVAGLCAFKTVHSRLQVLQGYWHGTLIDDCYNANPVSVKAAVDVLAKYPGRKTLVLGDMAELGEASADSHAEVGTYAARQQIDVLLTCGKDSAYASEAFAGNSQHFADKTSLLEALSAGLQAGDVVLIKGSRSAAMETLVEQLQQKGH